MVDSISPELIREFGSADSADNQREYLRNLCLRSTYAFGSFICKFKDLNPDLHGAMCSWGDHLRKGARKLGIAPRDHLKSSCWTEARLLRRATQDPHRRICLCNETVNLPIKWITSMQGHVLSERYRWLFPEVVPDPSKVRWNQVQLELKREQKFPQATIEGFGVGTARTGNHYCEVHEDDLVGEEAFYSPTVMQKSIDYHKRSEDLLIDPKDPIMTVGTRWGAIDIIGDMLRTEPGLDVFFLSCWKPNGDPIWPERHPRESLEAKRIKHGPAFFSLQYENRVIASGVTEFDTGLLGRWNFVPGQLEPTIEMRGGRGNSTLSRVVKLSECSLYQVLDAGLSKESQDARTANVVVALTPPTPTRPFDIILLEARASRSDPAGAVEQAHEVFERWQPVCCAVEIFGGHETFFYWIPSTYPTMRLRKLPTDTHKSKFTRIREFYPFVAQGRLYVHNTQVDFLEEYESFPKGRTVDLVDALAYMPKIWAPPDAQHEQRKRGVSDFDLADNLNNMDFIGPADPDNENPCGY